MYNFLNHGIIFNHLSIIKFNLYYYYLNCSDDCLSSHFNFERHLILSSIIITSPTSYYQLKFIAGYCFKFNFVLEHR